GPRRGAAPSSARRRARAAPSRAGTAASTGGADRPFRFRARRGTAARCLLSRAWIISSVWSVLAVLHGRALDRQELLEVDDAVHVRLDRAPVGLRLRVGAEPVGELLVDLLPRGIRRQQRGRGVGDDLVAEPAQIRQAEPEAGEAAAPG